MCRERKGEIMKKLMILIISLLCVSICVVCFAEAPASSKSVKLCYHVDDLVLMAQNDSEDIEKGKIEFEKEIYRHYGKRFIINSITRITSEDEKCDYKTLVAKKKPDERLFMFYIQLAGEGTRVETYQNAFGAQKQAKSKTVKLVLLELMYEEDIQNFSYYNYGLLEYGSGTVALGKDVYVVQKNARKNTKNAVRGAIRDACQFNDTINKYAEPEMYRREIARFKGDFR